METITQEPFIPHQISTNPEHSISPQGKSHCDSAKELKELLEQICSQIQINNFEKGAKLASQQPLIYELVCDRLQIQKLKEILVAEEGAPQFSKISLNTGFMNPEREMRLQQLLSLKKKKSLNSVVAMTISRNLQQIISDIYQRKSLKGNSALFDQLYDSLNKIQDKINFHKSCSGIQMDHMLKQQLLDQQSRNIALSAENEQLKSIKEHERRQKQAVIEQKWTLQNELALQRKQNLQQTIKIKQNYLQELKLKNIQFRRELSEIKKTKKQGKIQIEDIYEEIDVNVDDFKNLIIKLNDENKILKEERKILMAKVQDLTEKVQTISIYNDTGNAQKDRNVQLLRIKLKKYRQQIFDKNKAIEEANLQLELLRSFTDQGNKNNQSNISFDVKENFKKREENVKRLNEPAYGSQDRQHRMKELQELRKLDLQAVKSLSKFVNQLTNKVSNNMEQVLEWPQLKIQSLEQTIKELQLKIIASEDENENLKSKLNSRQAQTLRLEEKNKQDAFFEKNLRSMTEKIRFLQSNLEHKEKELLEERETAASLNSIITQTAPFTDQLMKENEEMREKLKYYKQQNSELTDLVKQKEKDNKQLQNSHFKQMTENQLCLGEQKFKLIQLQEKVQEFQNKLSAKDKEIEQIQLVTKQKEAGLEKRQLQLKDKNSKIQQLEQVVKQYESKLIVSENKYKYLVVSKEFKERYPQKNDFLAFFPGEILQDEPQYKLFLRETLEKRSGRTIRRTKILYRLDSLNKINFHSYIDNNEQIVVLVKLINGYVIAAYSEGKIFPKMTSTKDGLIISLNNRQVFQPLEKNRRVVTYDQFFLIIGNSQFRLRSQQIKFFSNFGIANGYFKSRGKKVDVLMGTLEREMEMSALQVHQIQFL